MKIFSMFVTLPIARVDMDQLTRNMLNYMSEITRLFPVNDDSPSVSDNQLRIPPSSTSNPRPITSSAFNQPSTSSSPPTNQSVDNKTPPTNSNTQYYKPINEQNYFHTPPRCYSDLLNSGVNQSPMYNVPSVNTPPNSPQLICSFCKKNGETPLVYTEHTIRGKVGNKIVVTCPILRSHVCPTCGATGDNAHTLTYCPVLRNRNQGYPIQSTTITLKNTRVKSNGRRRY